jgi:transposase
MYIIFIQQWQQLKKNEFADTKGVFKIRKSKKSRQTVRLTRKKEKGTNEVQSIVNILLWLSLLDKNNIHTLPLNLKAICTRHEAFFYMFLSLKQKSIYSEIRYAYSIFLLVRPVPIWRTSYTFLQSVSHILAIVLCILFFFAFNYEFTAFVYSFVAFKLFLS